MTDRDEPDSYDLLDMQDRHEYARDDPPTPPPARMTMDPLVNLVAAKARSLLEGVKPPLTDETILTAMRVLNAPHACPVCGDADRFHYSPEASDDGYLGVTCRCKCCGHEWTSIYMLVGVVAPTRLP